MEAIEMALLLTELVYAIGAPEMNKSCTLQERNYNVQPQK